MNKEINLNIEVITISQQFNRVNVRFSIMSSSSSLLFYR